MDAEHVQALLSRFYGVTDPAIQAYGGHVIDHAGDGVVAVFGAPIAYGNDGERAVRAALELHTAAAQLVGRIGPPAPAAYRHRQRRGGCRGHHRRRPAEVRGDRGHRESRRQARRATRRRERPSSRMPCTGPSRTWSKPKRWGRCGSKGSTKPVRAWRVRALRPAGAERRPFVGRQNEMRQLLGALDTVLETGGGLTICIRGEPGIGKTRLMEELRASAAARGFACHTGHVLDFGVGKGQDAIPVILRDLLQVSRPADEAARRSAVERGLRGRPASARSTSYSSTICSTCPSAPNCRPCSTRWTTPRAPSGQARRSPRLSRAPRSGSPG